jgi:hypothetical protein
MGHDVFRPRTAKREEKRQANEALGRSFCKTIAEPVTNSDTSAKKKFGLTDANGNLLPSGLVELMFKAAKGTQLDTAELRAKLLGAQPKRRIVVEVVTARSSGRPVGEVVIIDQAEGMSADELKRALEDPAGDRSDIAKGMIGRNLFGRGLSDVMRAYALGELPNNQLPVVQTFDGRQLTIARGEWTADSWSIDRTWHDTPSKAHFENTFLQPSTSGTAVRFVIFDRTRCHIPDAPDIGYRLANFYMLRLIASDPNVELVLRQHRAARPIEDRVQYDFPVGQVIETFSRNFDPSNFDLAFAALKIDFLVVRSDSERGLRGPSPVRDSRENGMLIVDDLDAVYDLTFGEGDYEKADFLSRIYGIVRVNGLRRVLESYLNAKSPTSPLRPDRDGFNRDHEFAAALLAFIFEHLRPIYEKERKLLEEKQHGEFSKEIKKTIDDALKQLNKYFQRITELVGEGTGTTDEKPPAPTEIATFFPSHTKLIAGRSKPVLLLVRDDAVKSGAEIVATASEGFSVEPETERIQKRDCPRWSAHENFFAIRFSVSCPEIGKRGEIGAVIEAKDGDLLEATLKIDDVLPEPIIEVPETLEFRPKIANGRPGRRNNLVLFINPAVVSAGHYVRVQITKRTGNVSLIAPEGAQTEQVDVKLSTVPHQVRGQNVFRVLIPWTGTAWNQRAHVVGSVKVGGPKPLTADASIRLDELEEGGFFKDVDYDDLGETAAPSMFAAGKITVNAGDPLNRLLFGYGGSKEEMRISFDRRLRENPSAQQRLAVLLLEEASFRALEWLHEHNQLHLPPKLEVTTVHDAMNKYKYDSAIDIHKALVRTIS